MSEMSAEKKKEIEKYIIKSYFGGGKNVESLANGADVIKGTDDGYIPQLIVEVTYFGESGFVMIKWNIYGDSQQNSFAMRVCRERETEQNRCDSVDSMRYAWEAWRVRIKNKPIFLKKDKKHIEFSMRSMMLTHKPYQDDTEIAITGMLPGYESLAANNPFDIPCDVVVISKKDFDRLQKKIEELKKKLAEFEPDPRYVDFLKALYPEDDVEKLVQTPSAAKVLFKHYLGENKKLQKKIDELRDDISGRSTVIEHYKHDVTRLQKKIDFNAELAKQWEINYNFLLKRTGFDTVADLVNYLDSEAECDTLHEAISKLHDDAKKEIESLKAVIRRSDSVMLNELENNIDEWQKATGCDSPMKAESKIDELETLIEEWKKATERCTPFLAGLRLGTLRDSYIRHNRLLFGEVRPEHMVRVGGDNKTIRQYLRDRDFASTVNAINELESEIDEWRKATGCLNPHYAKIKIDAYDNYIDTKMKKKD